MPEAIFCSWLSWKRLNTHAYQVSAPCIAWFASLRSEEVVIGKSASGHFLLTVVMETMEYICAQSFISMCTIVGKFEKGRSDFEIKLPEAVCCWWLPWKLLRCHGGNVVCVCTEFHSNMCYY